MSQWTYMKEFMASYGFSIKGIAAGSSTCASPSTTSVVHDPTFPATPKKLKQHVSDVSVDSDGFPKLMGLSGTNTKPRTAQESLDLDLKSELELSPLPLRKRPASKLEDIIPLKPTSTASMKKPASCTGDFAIVKDSMKVSGGKHQSYIQHIPGGCKKKQLVVSISSKMVDGKGKDHRQVADALLKWAKGKVAPTKRQVLEHRDVMLKSL